MTSKPALPELCVGLFMLGFAAVVGFATAAIPQSAYAKVGPAVVPWAVTAGLALFGALLMLQAFRGGWEHEQGTALDLRSLAWLSAGLILNLILIDGFSVGETTITPTGGFIVASTLMFICTARAFGSPQALRDGVIGFTVAVVSFIGFDKVLGYKIGAGQFDLWISAGADIVWSLFGPAVTSPFKLIGKLFGQ